MRARTYGEHAGAWLDENLDLRRRREATLSNTLAERAHWLEAGDRELVLAVFRDGRSAVSIAQMLNLEPRLVRHRLKRLALRLQDPRVAYVVAHQTRWPPSRRAVARQLFIMGRSMREVTAELGVSLHAVRKHRDAIEAMCLQAQSHARAPTSPSRRWRDAKREDRP